METDKFYNAAIYLRLSRDDMSSRGGVGGSMAISNSISSQKDMLCAFVKKQDNMEVYDIYADDGFSGTNFDRPEFMRMMQDIVDGKVNCVIVKDLSRLGRDYIEAGRLIQKTFPAFSVRFIALTDQFDSLTADYSQMSLVVPVKNFVNDSYARDISCKVRSHQKVKRENGEFIGAFAAYGYKKSDKNRNLLVPDSYAACIVRRIFSWKISGYSANAISEMLDTMGILSPLEYKKINGDKFRTGFLTGIRAKWSAAAVKRILTNENYTGTLVQGKEERVNYKVKKSVKKPECQWAKAEDAHEAIISKEDFNLVQDLLKSDMRAIMGENKSHIYAGLLFCGDCAEPMIRRVNRYKGKETVSFICSTKNKGGACTRHNIAENELNSLILSVLKQQISLFADKSRPTGKIGNIEQVYKEEGIFRKEIERMYCEAAKYQELREGLQGDLERGIITEEDYRNFCGIFEKRSMELKRAAANQESSLKRLFGRGVIAGMDKGRTEVAADIKALDRITLVTFVKRIMVYEGRRIYLEMRYGRPF